MTTKLPTRYRATNPPTNVETVGRRVNELHPSELALTNSVS